VHGTLVACSFPPSLVLPRSSLGPDMRCESRSRLPPAEERSSFHPSSPAQLLVWSCTPALHWALRFKITPPACVGPLALLSCHTTPQHAANSPLPPAIPPIHSCNPPSEFHHWNQRPKRPHPSIQSNSANKAVTSFAHQRPLPSVCATDQSQPQVQRGPEDALLHTLPPRSAFTLRLHALPSRTNVQSIPVISPFSLHARRTLSGSTT